MVTASSGCCKGFPSCFLVLSFTLVCRMSVMYFFKISNRFWLNQKENYVCPGAVCADLSTVQLAKSFSII